MVEPGYLRRTTKRLVTSTRQNHALEHATVALLLRRSETPLRVMGRATHRGFYLMADLTTSQVETAAHEALARMRRGEEHLAVSPFCGTNLVLAGTLAALASMAVLGTNNRMKNLPNACAAATLAVLIAQPLGALVQRHLTTSSDIRDLRVVRVTRSGLPGPTIHKVETAMDGQSMPVPERNWREEGFAQGV